MKMGSNTGIWWHGGRQKVLHTQRAYFNINISIKNRIPLLGTK